MLYAHQLPWLHCCDSVACLGVLEMLDEQGQWQKHTQKGFGRHAMVCGPQSHKGGEGRVFQHRKWAKDDLVRV